MSVIQPIAAPLPGERVLGLAPEDAAAAATDWLRRPNLFPGRALTAPTLQGRQQWQAGRIAQRGQAFSPGVVKGLETSFVLDAGGETFRIFIEPGQGLAFSGEDVVLMQRLECDFHAVPAVAPPEWFTPGSALPTPPEIPATGTLLPRAIGGTAGDLLTAMNSDFPLAAVLVLQPVSVAVSDMDPTDPCDRCPCGDGDDQAATEDWRTSDAVRLLWYAWPLEWAALPVFDGHQRNALAHLIFDAQAALPPDVPLPWEEWGVPVALFVVDNSLVADRAAVVRQGGRAREARLQALPGAAAGLQANSRLPALWQARIEQFAEQIAGMGDPAPNGATLAAPFLKLPPCGLLPRSALDFSTWRSDFFPGLLELDVVPVPIEQLDVAVREAAPLAPIDLSAPERVRVMVPVTQASWEPRLLLQEVIAPEFEATLDRFVLTRARELGARQGLRNEVAALAQGLSGKPQAVPAFNDDAVALENESLSPWGPPQEGGGHRGTLREGVHQHFFDSAIETLTPQAGDNLYVRVHLDPDHPPRELMLQWLAPGPGTAGANWEHRAYWGEDLIAWGLANTAARLRAGELPEAGRWLELEVSAAALGLEGRSISGMAFALHGGNAAFGMAGTRNPNTFTKWFCNVLPAGARKLGDEPWDLLTHNDLWAPFEPQRGVVPAIPASVPLGNGGHTEPAAPGVHQHLVIGTSQFFAVAGGERLFAWVYLDPANPPREVMLQWLVQGSWEHRAFWGWDQIGWGSSGTASRRRGGSLPVPGQWVRLDIDAALVGLVNAPVDGIAFTLFDGCAAFAGTGALNAAGAERLWFAGSLPNGARTEGTWQFLSARDLYAPTPASRVGVVQAVQDLYADPALAVLSGQERAQLGMRGLDGFVDYLRERIDRADDLTDYGFVKVQTDIYRVRQLMMGTTDASRLAISPALSAIARAETAVASQAQISEYLTAVKKVTVRPQAAPRAASPAARAAAVTGLAAVDVSFTPQPSALLQLQQPKQEALSHFAQNEFVVAGGISGTAAPRTPDKSGGTTSNAQHVAVLSTFEPVFNIDQFVPTDVFYAKPVVGKSSVRTTAIAERLKDSASKDARDYALATRHQAVLSLLRLVDEFTAEDGGVMPGLFEGFQLYGLEGDPFLSDAAGEPPKAGVRQRSLAALVANRGRLGDLLLSPARESLDEGVLFSEVSDVSDNSVAALRQLEGRVLAYRNALARAERALTALQADYQGGLRQLSAAGERVAEARHDVGVARALMAEEQARLEAINARRAAVLADEVRFLAFARVRETSNALAAPSRVLDPALAEAPVPACLRDHHDVPDELEDMLRVVREAPAAWFIKVPPLLDLLDRHDLLLRTLQSAQLRTPLLAQRALVAPAAVAASGRAAVAVAQVLARQAPLLQARALAASAVNLQVLATATWQGVRAQAVEVVSLGDLIDGEHGKSDVARRAAAEFNRIGAVGTCLHAEFSAVLPAIRLDWAEVMSQFDAAPNLRNLGNLPRWSEIDSVDRRQMQAYVDFIFAQIEPRQSQAEALVNDVVRMCLLLASHAPVGRIIAGRLPRPVTSVRPGLRIPLVALEPAKLRVGMQAIVYRDNAVVARALVEDVGGAEVSARVLHVATGVQDLGMEVRVQFDHAEVLSAAPQRSGSIFKR